MHALLTLVKHIVIQHQNCRVLILLDSRVTLGGAAKGRSAAPQLNGILHCIAAHTLAANVYLGFDFVPTRLNPSDGPSRFRAVPLPRQDVPEWLTAAANGNFEGLDTLAGYPLQRRCCSDWARFALSIACLGGVALRAGRDFDSSLGFPG